MNIFCFTNKGTNSKINNDTILFTSEAISGNPLIINEQNNYSHFINSIEGSAVGLVADGLGDTFASRLAAETYNENFLDLIEIVGEREAVNWIMHNFIKLEVNAARESADDKNKAMSGASIAGILYHKFAGVFIFHAGDSKIFAVDKYKAIQITKDHINCYVFNGYVLENCACAGGGHYISIEGSRRNKNHDYFIATNSMCELLSKKYSSAEEGVYNIMKLNNAESSINELKKLSENYEDNITALGLTSLFEYVN